MKFLSERYPQLRVNLPDGKHVRFREKQTPDGRVGELDTTSKAAIDALKGLAAEYGVRAAATRAPKGGDGKPPKDGDPEPPKDGENGPPRDGE